MPYDVGLVITRAQELPFDRLTWENFERLRFRLVQWEADVEHCQILQQLSFVPFSEAFFALFRTLKQRD